VTHVCLLLHDACRNCPDGIFRINVEIDLREMKVKQSVEINGLCHNGGVSQEIKECLWFLLATSLNYPLT
jgi:hypothetical protein